MNKNNPIYEEYFINSNKFKKLYNLYVHQSILDKILDICVFFAILFTIMSFVLEFLIGIDHAVFIFIHEISALVLLIFILELFRDYAKSKSSKLFFKKHWIDLILVVFLSFYFLFSYFGLAKIRGVTSAKKYFQEAKHVRVIFNSVKK